MYVVITEVSCRLGGMGWDWDGMGWDGGVGIMMAAWVDGGVHMASIIGQDIYIYISYNCSVAIFVCNRRVIVDIILFFRYIY